MNLNLAMRSILAATLPTLAVSILAASIPAASAQAQAQAPKRVQTVTVKPPEPQTPADTAKALADPDRMSLQSDLAWVGPITASSRRSATAW